MIPFERPVLLHLIETFVTDTLVNHGARMWRIEIDPCSDVNTTLEIDASDLPMPVAEKDVAEIAAAAARLIVAFAQKRSTTVAAWKLLYFSENTRTLN